MPYKKSSNLVNLLSNIISSDKTLTVLNKKFVQGLLSTPSQIQGKKGL